MSLQKLEMTEIALEYQFLHIEFKEEDSFKANVVVFLLPLSPWGPSWTPACSCDGGQDEFLVSLHKASVRLISPLRPRGQI